MLLLVHFCLCWFYAFITLKANTTQHDRTHVAAVFTKCQAQTQTVSHTLAPNLVKFMNMHREQINSHPKEKWCRMQVSSLPRQMAPSKINTFDLFYCNNTCGCEDQYIKNWPFQGGTAQRQLQQHKWPQTVTDWYPWKGSHMAERQSEKEIR